LLGTNDDEKLMAFRMREGKRERERERERERKKKG